MSHAPAARNVLRILTLLADVGNPISATRIRTELDLPRSSTYHLLGEMEQAGYVVRIDTEKTYGLGMAAYAMGQTYTRQQPLVRMGRRHMDRIAALAGGSAHISRLSGSEIIYLYESRAPGALSLVTKVGVRLQAFRTASGKAMLSVLPEVEARAAFATEDTGVQTWRAFSQELAYARVAGFAEEVEEVSRGQRSVAVPVTDHLGRPAAALAVTFPVNGAVGESQRADLIAGLGAVAGGLQRRMYGIDDD